MKLLILILFVVITAPIAAITLALFKIGSSKILRIAEDKWKATGVAVVVICWFILFPIMLIASIVIGLYLYLTVKPTYI